MKGSINVGEWRDDTTIYKAP